MILRFRIYLYLIFSLAVFFVCQLINFILIRAGIPYLLNQKFLFFFVSTYARIVLFVIILVFIIFSLREIKKERERLAKIFYFALILGGGASNLADRISKGGVIDYFNFVLWQMNVADIFIVIGIIMLFFEYLVRGRNQVKSGRRGEF